MPSHIRARCCSPKLTPIIVSLIVGTVFTLLGCRIADRTAPLHGSYRVVERVIDGDTLLMENGERVRLIGVDTPETKHPNKPVQHFGKEAAAFTRRMVEGKRVRLEFDPATHHVITKTARNRGARWLMCSWRMALCSMRRLSSRATASLTNAFHLHGRRILDSWSGRLGSRGEGCG